MHARMHTHLGVRCCACHGCYRNVGCALGPRAVRLKELRRSYGEEPDYEKQRERHATGSLCHATSGPHVRQTRTDHHAALVCCPAVPVLPAEPGRHGFAARPPRSPQQLAPAKGLARGFVSSAASWCIVPQETAQRTWNPSHGQHSQHLRHREMDRQCRR